MLRKVELGSGGSLLGFLFGGSSGDQRSVKIGPFSSQIVSVRVKAGRDDLTFHSDMRETRARPRRMLRMHDGSELAGVAIERPMA